MLIAALYSFYTFFTSLLIIVLLLEIRHSIDFCSIFSPNDPFDEYLGKKGRVPKALSSFIGSIASKIYSWLLNQPVRS